jgi:1,4-alpha-glucan branching enzyme
MPVNANVIERGASLVPDGSGGVFSCWAPRARNVWISGSFNDWAQTSDTRLIRRNDDCYWREAGVESTFHNNRWTNF